MTLSSLRTKNWGLKTEDRLPRNEESLRPTEDTLADPLVLINSVGPHKRLVSLEQLVPACPRLWSKPTWLKLLRSEVVHCEACWGITINEKGSFMESKFKICNYHSLRCGHISCTETKKLKVFCGQPLYILQTLVGKYKQQRNMNMCRFKGRQGLLCDIPLMGEEEKYWLLWSCQHFHWQKVHIGIPRTLKGILDRPLDRSNILFWNSFLRERDWYGGYTVCMWILQPSWIG